MKRYLTIGRLSILFLTLFALSLGGIFAYEALVTGPNEKCAKTGQWWYAEERRCVTPIYIPNITKRAPGVSRAEASEASAREIVAIENDLAQQEKARQMDTDRQRAALRKAQGQ